MLYVTVDRLQDRHSLRHRVSGQWTVPARARRTGILQRTQHRPLRTTPTRGQYVHQVSPLGCSSEDNLVTCRSANCRLMDVIVSAERHNLGLVF